MGPGAAYSLHTRNAATSELFIYRLFISRRIVDLFSRELVSFADLFWFDASKSIGAYIRGFGHRIKLTRSPTRVKICPLFFNAYVQNTPSIRHFDTILTPHWQVSPALLTFRRHLPVTKAAILLTFCTYKVLYAKKKRR